jgi:hypothetical protein
MLRKIVAACDATARSRRDLSSSTLEGDFQERCTMTRQHYDSA